MHAEKKTKENRKITMLYFKFVREKKDVYKEGKIVGAISEILRIILPQSNPTLEENIDYVRTWYIEYDESQYSTLRELGLDERDFLVFKAPYKHNLGFWVDEELTLDDYRKFNLTEISAEEFEELWKREPVQPIDS